MDKAVRKVVVVGGGTAGWLSACLIAASADSGSDEPLEITIIESPDIPAIGVGEGTWPTIRRTLERIGIAESEFLLACDASFKQGSRFNGWRTGSAEDSYYHPFVPPVAGEVRDVMAAWADDATRPFAEAVSPQPAVCALDLAPRQRAMAPYSGALNYAYHFDAGKFVELLKAHAVRVLRVRYISDHVTAVSMTDDGDIAAVQTRANGDVTGDLFLDCTGHSALLLGSALEVPFIDRGSELFNDRALAAQVPYAGGAPIASQTIGTAHEAGWIWDIGLYSRRGVGCVYSSSHMSDDAAEATLNKHLALLGVGAAPAIRRLTFRSGHRERFWERNCLAVGLSAGFLEPLEASAIVLIELSLDALIDNFPRRRGVMDLHARRFNALATYRWDRIIDFLKLHYVLSGRTEPYWRDNREASSISPRLRDLLALWTDQPPSAFDLPAADEVFPAASYQYVFYGMGAAPPRRGPIASAGKDRAAVAMLQVRERTRALVSALPTNRTYLDALHGNRDTGPNMMQGLS